MFRDSTTLQQQEGFVYGIDNTRVAGKLCFWVISILECGKCMLKTIVTLQQLYIVIRIASL